jgi:hypothetical protein
MRLVTAMPIGQAAAHAHLQSASLIFLLRVSVWQRRKVGRALDSLPEGSPLN